MNNEMAEKIMALYRDAEAEARSRRSLGGDMYQIKIGEMAGLRKAAEAVCVHPVTLVWAGGYDVCATCGAELAEEAKEAK